MKNLGSRWPRKPGCVLQFDLRNMWLSTAGLDLKYWCWMFCRVMAECDFLGVLMAPPGSCKLSWISSWSWKALAWDFPWAWVKLFVISLEVPQLREASRSKNYCPKGRKSCRFASKITRQLLPRDWARTEIWRETSLDDWWHCFHEKRGILLKWVHGALPLHWFD